MAVEKNTVEKLKKEARIMLPRKVQLYADIVGVNYGKITIRQQKSRWGSCSTRGNLNFNCYLMLAPEYIQDYVVVHELAHLKERNHSKRFWEIVESIVPDYRKAISWLKSEGLEIIMDLNSDKSNL